MSQNFDARFQTIFFDRFSFLRNGCSFPWSVPIYLLNGIDQGFYIDPIALF